MTSLFPHPPYAEDQPHAQSIMYLHVMRASSMSFAFASLFQIPILMIGNRKAPLSTATLMARTLRGSGRALVVGAAAGIFMTWGWMRGREEIEWQDRAWRIIENKSQVKTDWVVTSGATVGAVAALLAARRGAVPVGLRTAGLGGASLGTAVGIPYMVAGLAAERNT